MTPLIQTLGSFTIALFDQLPGGVRPRKESGRGLASQDLERGDSVKEGAVASVECIRVWLVVIVVGCGAGCHPSSGSSVCETRITYGDTWIHGTNHPGQYDVAAGDVTWDGTCTDDGTNSYAVLSNGWKPYFVGHGGCAIALDHSASCATAGSCETRITYGDTWIHGANHPDQYDVAAGDVTWDGTCTDEGTNSYAVLSNGWKPYFVGHGACAIAFDHPASCGTASSCATRITYGTTWLPPPNHPSSYDDVVGRVFAVSGCIGSGAVSYEDLSNGWQPHYLGSSTCEAAFRWTNCGGLYTNPVIPRDCPDPGVLHDGDRYIMSCTSGDATDAFPIYVSPDLVTWTAQGYVLPMAEKPAWAAGDFWAPEIHKVGAHWVAYFSARNAADGMLSVGAAFASDPLGPYTALLQPLVHDAHMGHIDASEFIDTNGTPYLLWKDDGNAQSAPTPIHAAQLAPDGLSVVGTPTTLITNDREWEGPLVEGPWMIVHNGMYYLFYSGNGYATTSYAIGVARANAALGPFTKQVMPILITNDHWAGPGHCSVVDGHTDDYVVYHAWEAGKVGASPGRLQLVDQIVWREGWPVVPGAPSSTSRPMP